jgi:hypothetical protein
VNVAIDQERMMKTIAEADEKKRKSMIVIPDFAGKTIYSAYVCPRSVVPHIRTKSAHR